MSYKSMQARKPTHPSATVCVYMCAGCVSSQHNNSCCKSSSQPTQPQLHTCVGSLDMPRPCSPSMLPLVWAMKMAVDSAPTGRSFSWPCKPSGFCKLAEAWPAPSGEPLLRVPNPSPSLPENRSISSNGRSSTVHWGRTLLGGRGPLCCCCWEVWVLLSAPAALV